MRKKRKDFQLDVERGGVCSRGGKPLSSQRGKGRQSAHNNENPTPVGGKTEALNARTEERVKGAYEGRCESHPYAPRATRDEKRLAGQRNEVFPLKKGKKTTCMRDNP